MTVIIARGYGQIFESNKIACRKITETYMKKILGHKSHSFTHTSLMEKLIQNALYIYLLCNEINILYICYLNISYK